MRTLKVLCLLLVALTVRGTPVTEPSPEAKGATSPKAASTLSPSPLPKANPDAKSVTTESDAEILTHTTTDQSTTTIPDATSDTESSTDPGTDQSEVTTPSSSPRPSAGTAKGPKSSQGPHPKTIGGNGTERHRNTDHNPTTSPEPDTDVQSDGKQLSPDSGPKPDPSSKPRETSSTKTRDESKTKSLAGPDSKRPLLQPLVNKQKQGGPNPESKSQLGFGNGFGLPGSAFPINPRPILTGAGETGLNNFPLFGGDPTFVELPFQESFNNRQPSRGNPSSLHPRPVSPTGEGAFSVGSQGQGFEIPVNTGLVVNPPNNVPQNTGLFGVPPRGPFDFGQPFGNPTVQRPFAPGSSGFPQGTTPQPPLFFNSRPGGTPGLFAPNPSSSPPLFLNPNTDNSFARPTTPQPFPPRPSNPPPLFLNPVTPNPASRPSIFLTPQPGNLFIPEDRIPFSSSPNDLDDPSPFFNSLGDRGSNNLFPDRPSVLFLNPDRDVPPPRGPPSIFLNPEDSPPIFTSSRPRLPSGFPLGATTPSGFPLGATSPPGFPLGPTIPSGFPLGSTTSSGFPLGSTTPSQFPLRPTTPSPAIFPRPTTPSPLPRPITPTPFSPGPTTPSPLFPQPTTPTFFSPRPTTPSPISPRPIPGSFPSRPGISINSNGSPLTPSPFFPQSTLNPSPFFPSSTPAPGGRPVFPQNSFLPESPTLGPTIIVSDVNNRPALVTPVPINPGSNRPLRPAFSFGNQRDNFPHESIGSGIALQPPKYNYGEGPAYSYGYDIKDPATGNFQGKEEEKGADGVVRGSYHLLQPDGKTRVVNYLADDYNGFQADVNYLPPAYS